MKITRNRSKDLLIRKFLVCVLFLDLIPLQTKIKEAKIVGKNSKEEKNSKQK